MPVHINRTVKGRYVYFSLQVHILQGIYGNESHFTTLIANFISHMYGINVYRLCFYTVAVPILELRINKTAIKRKEGQNKFFH